jgi:hypothetical protein
VLFRSKLYANPPLIGRYFAFNYTATNQTQAVLYWYETSTFTINSTSQQKHVKISLIAYPEDVASLANVKDQLAFVADKIVGYWQPIKAWSQITMIVSQNGASLALSTTSALIAITVFYAFETRGYRKANGNAYRKLSKLNKEIVDAVQETEKNAIPTLEAITTAYQRTTGKALDRNRLLEKLSAIETTNIIKRYVANSQDEPVQAWKTSILIK